MPSLRLVRVDARPYGRDLAALAAGISAAEADLACVHGAPSLLRWRSKSGAVARRAGLVVVGGGRTGGGNLLLSDLGVDVEGTHDLVFGGGRGLRPAGATLARLAVAGSRFTLAGVRLSGASADQARQLTELDEALTHLAPALAPLVAVRPGRRSRRRRHAQPRADSAVAPGCSSTPRSRRCRPPTGSSS